MKKYLNLSLVLLLSVLLARPVVAVDTTSADETTMAPSTKAKKKKTHKHPRKRHTKRKEIAQTDEQITPTIKQKKTRRTHKKVAGIHKSRTKTLASAETGAPVVEPHTGAAATHTATRTARRAHHMAKLAPAVSIADITAAKGEGKVWVNTRSGVYHTGDSKWYGRTKHGKFMTTAEADQAGYAVSKHG